MKVIAALLFLAVCSNQLLRGGGESCSEGFMNTDLLTIKAQQIPNTSGSLSDETIAESLETRWIFDNRFTCTGVLTQVVIGIDIRSATSTRNMFPIIEVWNSAGSRVNRVASFPITLTPDNFTTSGVYTFTFPTPVSITNLYRLGVYQPPNDRSVVRFYKMDGQRFVGKVQRNDFNEDEITISGRGREIDSQQFDILIHPITGIVQFLVNDINYILAPSNCYSVTTNSFLSNSIVSTNSSSITNIDGVTDETRVFPDISITCDGIITSLIVGTSVTQSGYPLVQLRRSSILYNVLAINTDDATLLRTNMYNFTLSDPVEVKTGDILVINTTGSSPMYYQQFNGPLNYRLVNNELTPLAANDYPLISVVIQSTSPIIQASSSTIPLPTTTIATSGHVYSTDTNLYSSGMTSIDATIATSGSTDTHLYSSGMTSIPIDTTIVSFQTQSTSSSTTAHASTSSLPPTVQRTDNELSILLGTIISPIVVLLLSGIVAILIVTICVYRRRKATAIPIANDVHSDALNNPTYEGKEMNVIPSQICNPVYQGVVYEKQLDKPHHHMQGIYYHTGLDEQENDDIYNVLQGHLCVPTASERKQNSESDYEMSENINSAFITGQDIYSTLEEPEFFLEDPIYWEPGTDTDDIYQQLSDKKYREIIRHQIQLTGHLGSGQFGTVYQGVWNSPFEGPIDVAIKTLKDSTSEEEKVKFLQEAAIMGQFHHHNVVKLQGVVTIGDPTMIVIELISGGDLREYLQNFKPSPGELVLSTVPGLLLSFCHQIASGMEYLSKKCFVHRDLAARNILVADQGICKIADFGMSRDLQDENYYISNAKKIPIKWTAPEALHFKRYSTAGDVWSYGAVLYEIWSLGHKPFESYSNQESMRLIESGYRLPPPPGCSRAIYQMMIQCWHPQTSSRPTFTKLVSQLSSSDAHLLTVDTTVLGGPLNTGQSLYTDLQYTYKH